MKHKHFASKTSTHSSQQIRIFNHKETVLGKSGPTKK